jgi:uncharacterized protein YdeI (BOF family)
MKRTIAAVSFALLAAPVFAAQPQGLGRTSAIGPDSVFGFYNSTPAQSQVASSGATRSDTEIGTEAPDYSPRHVEEQPGYFDPS